ncbi:hypothetical protein ACHAWX_003355 [Stephanocyclus meneghinianus]
MKYPDNNSIVMADDSARQSHNGEITTDGPLPDLMQLRLPTALLSSFSTNSRLAIKPGELVDGEINHSFFVSHGNATASEDLYTLQMENHVHFVEWYQWKKSPVISQNKRKCFRIGETRSRYSINNQKSDMDLKRIGERTRTLLDQERKKRKEIVRLEDIDLCPVHSRGTAARRVGGIHPANDHEPLALEKEKISSKTTISRKRASASKRKRRDPTVDGWMPDTDDLISKAVAKDDRSNIIRLHGLPRDIQPDHIRKFFHGLNPSLIFVLPTINHFIEGWDACDESSRLQKQNIAVKRHPEYFRVFVKFQSVLIADAAMERRGESIGFDRSNEQCIKNDIVGAAISLSPVSRHVASYLQKHLAISTRKGEPIVETLIAVEKRISCVTDLAWMVAAKRLKLESLILKLKSSNSCCKKLISNYHFIPEDMSEYNSLVRVYNQLVDAHKKLELDISLFMMHTFDPSCLDDSAHRITQSVSHWLLDEISNAGNNLRESRLFIREGSREHFWLNSDTLSHGSS